MQFSKSKRLVVFLKVAALKNFGMITKSICAGDLLNKTAGCRPEILLKQ